MTGRKEECERLEKIIRERKAEYAERVMVLAADPGRVLPDRRLQALSMAVDRAVADLAEFQLWS